MSLSATPHARGHRRGRVNYTILGIGLAITLSLVAILGSGFGKDPHRIDTDALEGKPAPVFELVDLEGNAVSLSDYIGKQWVVINFWATWCQPCKIEHPHLVKAAELYPDVKWLGVVYQDEPRKARVFLTRKRVQDAGANGGNDPGFLWNSDGAHLIDPSGAMSVDYGVTGVPETFFINPEGIVVKKYAQPIGAPQIMSHLGPPKQRMQQ